MAAEVLKIQDYAIIGNVRSAALISNHGSLDWLCWPRFDGASILRSPRNFTSTIVKWWLCFLPMSA